MPAALSYIGRRTLAHLPVWLNSADEKKSIKAQTEAHGYAVRSYPLDAFTERLAEDQSINPKMTESQVEATLKGLANGGLAEEVDGEWRMTEAGFQTLTASTAVEDDQTPGVAFLELHPAESGASAEIGG